MLISDIRKTIREIPDFPKEGINFYDVSTLFLNPEAYRSAIDTMVERFRGQKLDALAGIEARGLVLASTMAYQLGIGMILIRKPGKLPGDTESEEYTLEYGTGSLEMHRDAVTPGQKVVVVDDLLATGGTAVASGKLLERLGASVEGYAFMVELKSLGGRKRLVPDDVFSLIQYD